MQVLQAPTSIEEAATGTFCFLFPGSALDVLIAARNAIHGGWELLHHPLYGNFRPHQQPYRSLILRHSARPAAPGEAPARIVPDSMSLHLIEEALGVYQSVPVLVPDEAPAALRDACTTLDFELLRLPLQQAGWSHESIWAAASAVGLAQ